MYTDKDLLMMAAARLYSLGVDLEGARERVRRLAEDGKPYAVLEMTAAVEDFRRLDRQWKELEEDYLELWEKIQKEGR